MEKKNSKNKKIIAIVVILVIIAIAIGVGIFLNDRAQEEILSQEIDKINTTGEVNTEIKSNGKYSDVEKALKDYVVEYQSTAKEIASQYENESFTTILSADNLKNDGPEFTESKKLIADTQKKGEEVKTKLAEMVSDQYKEKRASDIGLTGKYKDLFIKNIQLEKELKTVNSTIDNINNYLTKIDDVFNFLIENKGTWEVKTTAVEFKQMSLVTKYNSLLTSVNIAAKKINITQK